MKLPVLPPQVIHPGEDLYEIHERPPVTASRQVRPRTIPPYVLPRHREAEDQESGRAQGEAEAGHEPGTATAVHEYSGEERRHAERRVAAQTIMLDTRISHDRRHDGHRPEVPVEIDEEA